MNIGMGRDHLKMLLTFVCLLVRVKIVSGSFPISLRNVAVIAGQRMEMECRTDNGTNIRQWTLQRIAPRKSDNEKIWTNWEGAPNRKSQNFTHFGIELDADDSVLIYSNATRLEDAGIYTCAVQSREFSQPTLYSAHLIVFEGEPHCEKSQSATFFTRFQCTVVVRGHLKPSMQWKLHCNNDSAKQNGGQELLTDELIFHDSEKSTFTSGINVTFDWESNSCHVSCKTFFEWKNSSSNASTATNVPSYNYIWSSSEDSWNSNGFTVAVSTHNGSTSKQMTPTDHKTIDDPSRTTVLVVALVIACLIAVVCGFCCIACMCYRGKFSVVVESNSLEPAATRKMLLTPEYTGMRFASTDPYSVDPAAESTLPSAAETEDGDDEAEAAATLSPTEPGYCCLTSPEINFPSEVDEAIADECGAQSTDYEEVRPRTGFFPAPNPREKDEIRIHGQEVADEAGYADVKIESNYLHFGKDIIAPERDDCEIGLSDDDYSSLKIPSSYLEIRYD